MKVLDPEIRRVYWQAVSGCLQRLHGLEALDANVLVSRFRYALTLRGPGVLEVVYHDEPFHLACELYENALDIAKHGTEYDRLLEEIDSEALP